MKKKVAVVKVAEAAGIVVMSQMMQAELTERIGEKCARIPAVTRVGNWHGTTKGSVVLGARTLSTEHPRGRSTDDTEIDTWKVLSPKDLLNSLIVERALAGGATRRHTDVAGPVESSLCTPHPADHDHGGVRLGHQLPSSAREIMTGDRSRARRAQPVDDQATRARSFPTATTLPLCN